MSDLKVGSLTAITAPVTGAPANAASSVGRSDKAAPATAAHGRSAALPTSDAQAGVSTPAVQTSSLDPGEQPIDTDRVATIRSAIVSGRYPLVPARIGDAMIAAGILLQSGDA